MDYAKLGKAIEGAVVELELDDSQRISTLLDALEEAAEEEDGEDD